MTASATRSELFTTPGAITFNVPADVSLVRVSMIGGGGSGGASDASNGGAGGSSAEYCLRIPYAVTPGGSVSGYVGAGGASASAPAIGNAAGNTGEDSTFGVLTTRGGPGAPASTGQSSKGGGYNGGAAVLADTVGNSGNPEAGGNHCGGASGGGGASSAGSALAGRGGHSLNFDGGDPGAPNGSGGGGGASPWGRGGNGGRFTGSISPTDGQGYGAGGGGTGRSCNTATPPIVSGAGADGMILVEWEE